MLKNISKVFGNKKSLTTFVVACILLAAIFYKISNYELLLGNRGWAWFSIEIILQLIIVFLFSLFLGLNVLRSQMRVTPDKKSGILGTVGGFMGVLVVGCPICGVTLAGMLGLGGIIAFLPFDGVELKLAGIALLLYANFLILRNFDKCNLKQK